MDMSELILKLVRIKHFQGDTTTMNLKLVVASMSILGLVSCPVFAATQSKHKSQKQHKMMKQEADYKGMGSLVPAPEVCTISQSAMIMDRMTQSTPDVTSSGLGFGRSMPNPCNPGWFNRVQFSGGINVDLGKFGNRNSNFMGVNYQRISLNDGYINVAAAINDWTKAFASISYSTASVTNPSISALDTANPIANEYSAAYSNNINGAGNSTLQLEQAYATFSNFDMTPFFLQVGKQFQDFSRYEIHPITRSLTQVLSETLATSFKVGFIANGFNGSVYAFDDPIAQVGKTSPTTNYGASLGFDYPSDLFGFDIGISYLYNMIGVNDVAWIVNQYNGGAFNPIIGAGGGYNTRVSAGALYADVNSGPFVLGARYTQALQRFNVLDMPKNALAGAVVDPGVGITLPAGSTGAKPWAAGVQAGYGFEGWGRNQNVYLGYQTSGQAAAMLLPKYRWVAGYGIELFGKNTDVGIEWDHDKAYSVGTGGTNNSYNLVTIRTSVKFG